jgi:hypothetical protein
MRKVEFGDSLPRAAASWLWGLCKISRSRDQAFTALHSLMGSEQPGPTKNLKLHEAHNSCLFDALDGAAPYVG